MTATQILRASKDLGTKIVFRFPYLQLIHVSAEWAGLDEEEREQIFSSKLRITVAELRSVLANNLLSLQLLTPDEERSLPPGSEDTRGHHWLSAFVQQELEPNRHVIPREPAIRVVHFYGYKGGQARSTLLAILAKTLAEDGWKVLAVDSDIEAPSLDIIFARTPRTISGTLLGLAEFRNGITPERLAASTGLGFIDLISCRPRTSEFDIDAAALALRSSIDPNIVDDIARKVGEFASVRGYDAVLIDHRSGLAAPTLSWMAALPGPTVICVRLDEQWRPAESSIKTILRENPANPGVFVSWKPDDESFESYRQRNYTQITALLDLLADAIAEGADMANSRDQQIDLSFAELEDHWIVWPYDSAFRQLRLPEPGSLSGWSNQAVAKLRSVLDVAGEKRQVELGAVGLSPSGATDPGDLIQTDALRQLKIPENSISYILGRKGTGKTRLVRELAAAKLGEPLVVDPYDTSNMGLRSASPELGRASTILKDDPIRLWWHLLSAALDCPTTSTQELIRAFSRELEQGLSNDASSSVLSKVGRFPRRVFMVDGLETAFQASTIFQFVESLFRFLQIVESDPRLSSAVQFKLFLRTDLAQRGYQNIEQQLHGRTIYLSWDTQKIFNFVLSRIARIEWYRTAFPRLVDKIGEAYEIILNGSLPVETCEDLLLLAFPHKLSRNNLATKTFLKTYFADTASDKPEISTADKLRYYPRIFDKFLEVIANPRPTDLGSFTGPRLDKDGKISQSLIFFAHEAAAADYLEQLRSELNYLISFSPDPNQNSEKVRTLLAAFDGLKTPFHLDEHIETLTLRTNIDVAAIREAMHRMKNMGLFEDRPGYPEEWRVGRLFKSSLKMKYVRGRIPPYGM
jgi:Mrp family chromosome partitioning ATPase